MEPILGPGPVRDGKPGADDLLLADEPVLIGMGIFWRRAAILMAMVGMVLMGCAAVLVSEPLFYMGLSATIWGPLLCLFAGVVCISRGEDRKQDTPEPLPEELLFG